MGDPQSLERVRHGAAPSRDETAHIADILDFARRYRTVYVKPAGGSLGKGIYVIQRSAGAYASSITVPPVYATCATCAVRPSSGGACSANGGNGAMSCNKVSPSPGTADAASTCAS